MRESAMKVIVPRHIDSAWWDSPAGRQVTEAATEHFKGQLSRDDRSRKAADLAQSFTILPWDDYLRFGIDVNNLEAALRDHAATAFEELVYDDEQHGIVADRETKARAKEFYRITHEMILEYVPRFAGAPPIAVGIPTTWTEVAKRELALHVFMTALADSPGG